jgi:integrase
MRRGSSPPAPDGRISMVCVSRSRTADRSIPKASASGSTGRVAGAGVPRIPFHGLRHSHVAHVIAAGKDGLPIAKRLGHHSAAFSLDRYGHLFPEADSEAAAAVAAQVDGGVSSG